MFSAIVPLFNKSAYIEKCLRSIINQTCQDFEIIVVNDGSTDDGAEKVEKIILQLKEKKQEQSHDEGTVVLKDITIDQQNEKAAEKDVITKKSITGNIDFRLINQANLGVSTARNNGVKAAKSEYIAFLDADDWWEPTYLAEMENLIKTFPDAGIYGCSYYIVRNQHKRLATIGVESNFGKGILNYCKTYSKTLCMPLWTCATIITKKLFVSNKGFNPSLKLGEDFDLWIRLALKYPVAFLNKPLVNYNQDVALETRGVSRRFYDKDAHFAFNLGYLEDEEKKNKDLKVLLDNLKATSLEHYYIHKRYIREVNEILNNIDFNNLPTKLKLSYTLPFPITKARYDFYKKASWLKNEITRIIL